MFLGEHDQHSFANTVGNLTKLIEQAVILDSIGRFDDALPILAQALSIDTNDIYALINKGRTLSQLYNFEEVISYHDKALKIEP